MREHPLKHIETSHIVKLVREAAALRPDRVAKCRYLYQQNNKPMCIVGEALVALGVDLVWLRQHNCHNIGELYGSLSRTFNKDERRDLAWLHDVQVAQDHHNRWARAVERADQGRSC